MRDRLTFPVNAAAIGAIFGGVVGGLLAAIGPVPLDASTGASVGGVIGSGLGAAAAWFADRPVTPLPEWHGHLRARMRVLWVSGPRAPLAVTRSAGGVLDRLSTQSWKLLQSSALATIVGRRLRRWLPLPQGLPPGELYDRFAGSMLIVGEPGAGKSVLLWEILEALLDRDPATAAGTPVLLELHRWEAYDRTAFAAHPSFAGFVRRELAASPINVPADVGRMLLDDLVLLLDGLDELSDDLAIRCLESLRDFALAGPAGRRRRRIVMTCREADYERIAAAWDTPNTIVTHAVRVLPLPDREVRGVLEQANPNGRRLIATAERIPALGRMLRTPLWLSVASQVYRFTPGRDPLATLDTGAEQPAVERALYERWLTLRMGGRPVAFQRHLGFLAERMRANGQQTIYLEAVQPSWLGGAAGVRWARGLGYALTTLAAIWLLLAPAAVLAAFGGETAGLFASVPGGWAGTILTVALPAAVSAGTVHLVAQRAPPRRRRIALTALRELPVVLLATGVLVLGLALVGVAVNTYWFLFYGAFVWFVHRASATGGESPRPLVAAARRVVPRRVLARHNLVAVAGLGLGTGTYFGLGVWLQSAPAAVAGLAGLTAAVVAAAAFLPHGAMVALPADRGRSPRPLGALWRSARTGVVTAATAAVAVVVAAVALALVIGVTGLVVDGVGSDPLRRMAATTTLFVRSALVTLSTIWVPIAVVTALEGGLGAVVEHATARVVAARCGWLPLRLVALLDDAAGEGILYPVGPGWRFRHRTLAEQLAADHRAAAPRPGGQPAIAAPHA
ncbi:MAG TPA: hypothetical protein VK875_07550 [Euzebyales bacterium]|nr:hypothetical protein [Euzebyales bacterium]